MGSAVRSSDSTAAIMRISAIFANSDGVSWNPPNSNQRCAPDGARAERREPHEHQRHDVAA